MVAMAANQKLPITLNDHLITTKLTVGTGETIEHYANRLLMQAFFPRAGMSEREMELLGKAHDYIDKYSKKYALEIIRMSEAELKETHKHIAEMFGINPRSRKVAS